MSSAKRLRKYICNAIVSASASSKNRSTNNSGKIDSELDNIFALYLEEKDDSYTSDFYDGDNDDNVTPLMVACDKCCYEALCYLQKQMRASTNQKEDNLTPKAMPLEHLVDAWGHPTEASSCGNSASHHALAAGFVIGLDALENLWGSLEDESPNSDCLHRYISLLSQTNQNGDTPLMMACVSGHSATIKHILEHSLEMGLDSNNVHASVDKIRLSLTDVFSMRNNEECTALNLACGHGHADIVKFFVQSQHVQLLWNNNSFEATFLYEDTEESSREKSNNTKNANIWDMKPLVNFNYADIDFCTKSITNLAAGLKFTKDRNKQDEFKGFDDQHKRTSECLIVLQRELERRAAVTANELLALVGDDETKQGLPIAKPATFHANSKSKGKSKKKKRQNRNTKSKPTQIKMRELEDIGDDSTNAGNRTSHTSWANRIDEQEKELGTRLPSIAASPFVTLQDGSIISNSQRSDYIPTTEPDHSSLDDAISNEPAIISGVAKPKTLQSILESTTSSIVPSTSSADGDMSSVMESLCLDPSMLLLSPHGMAMEMSPCQLDAIESILNHQLKATNEAQKIQRRLLDK